MRGQAVVLTGALSLSAILGTAWAIDANWQEATAVPIDHPAIQYMQQAPAEDAVAKLEKKLETGQVKLDYASNGWGYLRAILKQLGLNIDSQVLVFSKTSFQAARISPRAPRALYFNDDVMVGYVQGGDVLEFAALDPKQGINFYTLDAEKSDQPGFARRDVCLQCHQGLSTLGVPGILVSSVYPDADGMPAFRGNAMITDDRSSFDQRWGGWYVTGNHGSVHDMANAVGHDRTQPQVLETQGTQNVTNLERKFDTSKYLAPSSDIVALMTLEHQTRMTNLMTRIGWDARIAEHDGKLDAQREQIYAEIDEMVKYMLFADEARIEEPVQGISTFTQTFPQRGPRDKKGRSLRDFDLQTRMFKYPLSYMIYSVAFDAMPQMVRDRVWQRLYEVLTGKDKNPLFARLTTDDRAAILEIVGDTKPNLPAYWKN